MPLPQFVLPYERCDEDLSFPVAISRSDDGTEQRRLLTNKEIRTFNVQSPNLTQSGMASWYTFYRARKGPLHNFEFQDPANGQWIVVRFEGSIRRQFARGFWRLSVTLVADPQTEHPYE